MELLLRPKMGSQGGRPKKNDDETATKQVRVFADLVEIIGWRARIEDVSSANQLDPLIRGPLLAWKEANKDIIERIQKAEEDAQRATEEAINLAKKRKKRGE